MQIIQCSVCGNAFPEQSATYHRCEHPGINKKYGKIICAACCTRCKYLRKEHLGLAKSVLAYSCGYGERENETTKNSIV
jgi:hypothetical protein